MHDPVRKRDFTKGALTADGYSGWTTFSALRPKRGTLEIPSIGGTYIVVRVTDAPPEFLTVSPAGWHRGEDPTVPLVVLKANWVEGARVLYIGKAEDMDTRIRRMAAFAAGVGASHAGGRLVWQLEESPTLLVGWRPVRAGFTPLTDEGDMIRSFRRAHNQSPFANYPNRMGR